MGSEENKSESEKVIWTAGITSQLKIKTNRYKIHREEKKSPSNHQYAYSHLFFWFIFAMDAAELCLLSSGSKLAGASKELSKCIKESIC